MKRLQLGLTDIERNHMEQARRLRNCLWVITACLLVVGLLCTEWV